MLDSWNEMIEGFGPVVNSVITGMTFLGLILLACGGGVSMVTTATRGRADDGPKLAMIVGLMLLGPKVLAPFSLAVMDSVVSIFGGETSEPTAKSSEVTPAPSPTPAPAPEPSPVDVASTPFDWTPVLWIGGGVLLLALTLGAIALWWGHLSPRITQEKERKQVRAAHVRAGELAWGNAQARYREDVKRWLSYETDVRKAMDFPLMRDLNHPLVQRTVAAMSQAQSMHREHPPVLSDDVEPSQQPFVLAADEFHTALKRAVAEAHRVRRSLLTRAQRKNLDTAERLFAIVTDPAAAPNERQMALKQMNRLLEGIISVPEQVWMQIESSTRLALVA